MLSTRIGLKLVVSAVQIVIFFALAQWLIGGGVAPESYIASQGTRLGRAGRVHIVREGETVWVGGGSVSCVRGDVAL